jgi:hypothetical protein
MEKYKEITNRWNYDASCMLTTLPVSDSEHFKRLIFVAQSVQGKIMSLFIIISVLIIICVSSRFFLICGVVSLLLTTLSAVNLYLQQMNSNTNDGCKKSILILCVQQPEYALPLVKY